MKYHPHLILRTAIAVGLVCTGLSTSAFAQSDEIQVYDGGLADVGNINLTWHNNFAPKGAREPAFQGALINNRNLNGVTEWAYGVTNWFEAGLYLPLYSLSAGRGPSINGGKLRALFAVPNADDRGFFYGANFEFSFNSHHWDERRYTSEIRPIIGVHLGAWHLKPIDIIFNPILDNSFYGGFKSLDFAPSTRIAYNINNKWAVAVEHYADLGPLRKFYSASEQSHQIFAVFNRSTSFVDIEAGIGVGVTGASDKLALKLLLSKDLHVRKKQ
ncbi:MAG: hypothetical protein ABI824_16415 [Acidobacteriota bacterium]